MSWSETGTGTGHVADGALEVFEDVVRSDGRGVVNRFPG